MIFDSHRYVKRLMDAGVPEQEAEAYAAVVFDVATDASCSARIGGNVVLGNHRYVKTLMDAGVPEQAAVVYTDALLDVVTT